MRIKSFSCIVFFVFLILTATAKANLEGYTITGKVTDSSGNPLYNSQVILHSTVGNCECNNEIADYTSITGHYSSSVDNLVFSNNCNVFNKGDACANFINPEKDLVWIEIKGKYVLPKPFGNSINQKETWSNYQKSGSIYFGINSVLPGLTQDEQKKVVEERIKEDEFWQSPGIISITNKSLAQPEIDNITVEFTETEINEIFGKEKAKEIISILYQEIKKQKIKEEEEKWFGVFVLILSLIIILVLLTSIFRKRKKEL